jgi:hypothetical protein
MTKKVLPILSKFRSFVARNSIKNTARIEMGVDENQLLGGQTILLDLLEIDSEHVEQLGILDYHIAGRHQKLMVGQPHLRPGLTTYGHPSKKCGTDRHHHGAQARDVSNFHDRPRKSKQLQISTPYITAGNKIRVKPNSHYRQIDSIPERRMKDLEVIQLNVRRPGSEKIGVCLKLTELEAATFSIVRYHRNSVTPADAEIESQWGRRKR